MGRGLASSPRQQTWPQVAPEEVWIRHKEKLLLSESGQALEWLPREVVELPSLPVFKRHLDEELRDTVEWLVVAMVMGEWLD